MVCVSPEKEPGLRTSVFAARSLAATVTPVYTVFVSWWRFDIRGPARPTGYGA